MLSLRELYIKRRGAQASRKITAAMKMVASSKLRHAQSARAHSLDVWARWQTGLRRIIAHIEPAERPKWIMTSEDTVESHHPDLLIIVTSEQGLCGSFNARVLKQAKKIRDTYSELPLICVGQKGINAFQGLRHVQATFPSSQKNQISLDLSGKIALKLQDLYTTQNIRHVWILANQFVSALTQKTVLTPLLPFSTPPNKACETIPMQTFICEPKALNLLQNLFPCVLKQAIHTHLWNSLCSEHAERMNTMDQAIRNADDMIFSLTLTHNRLRQARITKELIEVISGFESIQS